MGFLLDKLDIAKLNAQRDVVKNERRQADMMLNSTFPADALERLRARTLVNLTQAKDHRSSLARRSSTRSFTALRILMASA